MDQLRCSLKEAEPHKVTPALWKCLLEHLDCCLDSHMRYIASRTPDLPVLALCASVCR